MLKLGSRLARWIALLIALSGTSAAFAQSTGTIQGITYQGGVSAAVSGLNSTNYLDGVIPFATVCVYFTGTTTLAPIFADAKNTPRNSCFTSDSLGTLLPGHFIFWAAVGQGYDVVGSGGIAPNAYSRPVPLLTDVFPGAASGGGGGACTGSFRQITYFSAQNVCSGDPLFSDLGNGAAGGLVYTGNGANFDAENSGSYQFTGNDPNTINNSSNFGITLNSNGQGSANFNVSTTSNSFNSGNINLVTHGSAANGDSIFLTTHSSAPSPTSGAITLEGSAISLLADNVNINLRAANGIVIKSGSQPTSFINGIAPTTTVVTTTPYAVGSAQETTTFYNASGGNIVANLPTTPLIDGTLYIEKKLDSSANTVTLTPHGGAIDGAGSYVLKAQYQWVALQYDLTIGDWHVFASGPFATGTLTAGHCVQVDATGTTFIDSGVVGCSGAGGGGSAFNALTSGVNTTFTGTVGTGATINRSGTGIIDASAIGGITITGTPSVGFVPTATGSSTATWQAGPTAPAFSAITTGTSTVPLHMGAGGTLDTVGGGTIAATTAINLATTPTVCGANQYAAGVGTNGNAICIALPTQPASQYIAPQAISGCGVEYVSGLTYNVGACTYSINGTIYHSPLTSVTLSTADPTNPRIDVIFVDTTQTVQVLPGTPAATPQQPSVDPSKQLELTFVLVNAAATTPANTTLVDIYLEGVEWTGATGGTNATRVNLTSTNNPFTGTHDTEFGVGGTVATTTFAGYTVPSAGTVNLANYNTLTFYIRNKAAWLATNSITVQWFNGTTLKGTGVVLSNGAFGYDAVGNTTSYQQVSIPTSTFGIAGIPVTSVRFTVSGSGAALTGFYLDQVTLQGGSGGVILPTTLMNFKGAWSSTATYNPNDTVTSGGAGYVALAQNTNVAVTTAATWAPLAPSGVVSSFSAPPANWPLWLVPSVANGTSTPSLSVTASPIPYSALTNLAANTVLGALTPTTPSGLPMPSCSTAGTSALTWTSGVGFGCNAISGGGGGSSVGTAGQLQMVGSTAGSFAASHATDNGTSFNISEPTTVNDGTGNAGSIGLLAGTTPGAAPANTVQINAPASVTAYSVTLPSAQGTGALTNNGSGALSWTAGGGTGAANVVYASVLGCAQGVDLTAGLMPNGSAPTDATTCLSNALTAATPENPITLVVDGPSYGAIYGPANGGWKVVAAHKGGIGRAFITAWSCVAGSPITCTFTTTANQLLANQYVSLGLFGTTTAFNQQLFHVISTGLSSTQFEATAPAGFATTGSSTEAGEADYLYGDGLYAPQGLNNDVVANHPKANAGGCVSGYSDPGWITPGPAPSRGSGIEIDGISINGFRGNGTTGNSTSGTPNGTAPFVSLYGPAYCSYMGINIGNMEHVTIDGVTIYNTPAYNIRLMNTGHVKVVNSTMSEVFPNGPTTSHTGGLQGDGIHLSGGNEHIYIGNDFFESTDDAIALNAPEGWVGLIQDVNIVNSSFHNALTGLRAYTGSIAPPAGDATPLVKQVTIDNYSGDATQSIALFGLLIGSARTFTIPNSMTDITWGNSTVSGAAQGFQVDDTIGSLRFNNVDMKDITCANGTTGYLQNWIDATPIDSLSISNSHAIYTTANHCLNSMIYGGSAAMAIGTISLNGFGVINESGSNAMPQLLNLTGSSTITDFAGGSTIDYANISTLIPTGQMNQITTYRGRQFSSPSGLSVTNPSPTDIYTEVSQGMQTFTCPYALGAGIDSFNFAINRNCSTGIHTKTGQNSAYWQFISTTGATSSSFLVATTPTVNTLPPYEFKVGAGVLIGSSLIGSFGAFGADPGEGNLSVAGTTKTASLLASSIADGPAPVTVTTGTTATLGGTYKSGYTFNQEATAATAVAYTLPTAAAGLQYCVGNSYNGTAATTGVLTVNASAAGQFIIFTDGTLSATGGNVTSGGAAMDFACFVGVDSTHWYFKPSSGTWTKH